MPYITLNKENIFTEHICCAFSDKKCVEGYGMKKQWLAREFDNGYVFRRLDERAKVFIEYGPAEKAWVPVTAPNFLMIGCFWVSGKYKKQGHGKALLAKAIEAAEDQGKDGLVTVVGTKKFPFMSDTRWMLKQGFEVLETLPSGFHLIAKRLTPSGTVPHFNTSVKSGRCPIEKGLAVYYTNRCPFTEYHVATSLVETAARRGIALQVVKLETMEQAQTSPSPATIFSLFLDGEFITTDVSVCTDSRFDKIVGKKKP